MEGIQESDEGIKAANFYSNENIDLALSGLTSDELKTLNQLVEHEDSEKTKRETSKLKKKHRLSNQERIENEEETDYDNDYLEKSSSTNQVNCRGLCKGSCVQRSSKINDEEDENDGESAFDKSKFIPFKKRNSESTEKKIRARISSLKDKAKINSFGKEHKSFCT